MHVSTGRQAPTSPSPSYSVFRSGLLSVARVFVSLAAHEFLPRSSGDGGLGALVLVESEVAFRCLADAWVPLLLFVFWKSRRVSDGSRGSPISLAHIPISLAHIAG